MNRMTVNGMERRPTVAQIPVKLTIIGVNQDVPVDCGDQATNLILVPLPTEGGGWALHSPALDCWVAYIDPGDGRYLDEMAKFLAAQPAGGGVRIGGAVYRSANDWVTVGVSCRLEVGNLLPVEA